MEPDLINTAAAQVAQTDFSLLSLFLRADIVVKAVMVGLFAASIWSWAIIFEKWGRFRTVNRKAEKFEQVFWSGQSLEDIYQNMGHRPDHPMSTLFVAAMREWRRSAEIGTKAIYGLQERIDRVMTVSIARESARLERGLLFLATVGATAPFVGLFGTVWGIMNSFQAIAATRDTNLAVVAPGIAEALFATGLGLLAAIPAVIAYNAFSTSLNRYATRLDGFADEFSAILSRQIDETREGN